MLLLPFLCLSPGHSYNNVKAPNLFVLKLHCKIKVLDYVFKHQNCLFYHLSRDFEFQPVFTFLKTLLRGIIFALFPICKHFHCNAMFLDLEVHFAETTGENCINFASKCLCVVIIRWLLLGTCLLWLVEVCPLFFFSLSLGKEQNIQHSVVK